MKKGKGPQTCSAVEMMKKRLGMSSLRFWLQELELKNVMKAAQVGSGLGDGHSNYGEC